MAAHKELINSGSFDEKFKRAILDYYNYGFKKEDSFSKSSGTISGDWERLNNIVKDYFEWSNNRKEIMFMSADSQSMKDNPFHRIYRFCRYIPFTFPAFFLHTIAALSPSFIKTETRQEEYKASLNDNLFLRLEDLNKRIDTGHYSLTTSELLYYYPENIISYNEDDKNKTPNNRLDALVFLGIINCDRKSKRATDNENGHRKYNLPEITMKSIIEAGSKENDDFKKHFRLILDFFSKYYIFGEIGTFLLDRLGEDEKSPFRFKHEYFMHSLNDFNIIDLLYAIESKKWCKIKYSHGTAEFETELLCYPIEIRISNTSGREFLMYYEPFRRSYAALRIEFIDSIEYFEDKKIKDLLVKSKFHNNPDSIDSDIANAKNALSYSWGVSTTKEQIGNAINPINPKHVSMRIKYDPNTEYYIINRLYRERRLAQEPQENGKYLVFSIDDSDEVELRPWIRSFYSRIVSCEGMDTEYFSIKSDIKNMQGQLWENSIAEPKTNTNSKSEKWIIPEPVKAELKKGEKAKEHNHLFNELFSIYYYLFADVFTKICSCENDSSFTIEEIRSIIRQSRNKYEKRIGKQTFKIISKEIEELLMTRGFLEEKSKVIEVKDAKTDFKIKKTVASYSSKYKCTKDTKLYRDIVPLSAMELRWLKTITNEEQNPKIRLFLSKNEIEGIKKLLEEYAPSISPLPIDKLVYYDRYKFPEQRTEKEIDVLKTLLKCIYDRKKVVISYLSNKKEKIQGTYIPIVIEFSKRDNKFQGYFQNCKDNEIYTMNISQIENAEITNDLFIYEDVEKAFIEYREKNTSSVTIQFYDVRNMADRILTELSPWKKKCTFNPNDNLYTLEIFYQKPDELDLVIRLLGYGANLRFKDKSNSKMSNHTIYKEMLKRVNMQAELFAEQDKAISGDEKGEAR